MVGRKMRTISQETLDTYQKGDSILVLSPTFSETEPATCGDLLSHDGEGEFHTLCVTFMRSPVDHLINWRRHGTVPDRATFVNVDASATANTLGDTTNEYESASDVDVDVEEVSSPENLTRLGVRTTNSMESLTDAVSGHEITVCFDSITALLQYVDVNQAFQFLHVLTDQFDEANAFAHFHMDPGAHEDETIQTIKAVFDGVYTVEDG
jgi:hypothetical protein